MSRYIERAENIARLTEVGYRISLTPAVAAGHREDWKSTLAAAGCLDAFTARYATISAENARNFLLFDPGNPSSVRSCLETARNNGRSVRTAFTREVWEALNMTWIDFRKVRPGDVGAARLPEFLDWIRQRSNMFRGALSGTLLRDDGFAFSQLGAHMERADNTARILDVKYYVLLPSHQAVGGDLDAYQWEMILRSVTAHRSYRHVYKDRYRPWKVADFLILRREMPRSLHFCYDWIEGSLGDLMKSTGRGAESRRQATAIAGRLRRSGIDAIFQSGLHEFLAGFLRDNASLADAIADDFNFS